MTRKAPLVKRLKFIVSRWAKKFGLLDTLRSISKEKYAEKFSASLFYGLMSSIAVNFFFQPGHVYSSGATGLAQVISAISERWLGFTIPVSVAFYAINLPPLVFAFSHIERKKTKYKIKKEKVS